MKETNRSEVARFRQQVEQEYEAAQRGLTGPAIVSRHDFITKRMEGIAAEHGRLVEELGEEEAMRLLCEVDTQPFKPSTGISKSVATA